MLSNYFLIMLLTFFQISLYFSNNFSSFIKKDKKSFIKSLLYALIFERNMHRCLIFFSIFIANKIVKILFTRRYLIRYYHFINIYIVYGNRVVILVKFVFFNFSIIKLYNFLSIFIYDFRIFLQFF